MDENAKGYFLFILTVLKNARANKKREEFLSFLR